MRKLILSSVVILAFVFYVAYEKSFFKHDENVVLTVSDQNNTEASAPREIIKATESSNPGPATPAVISPPVILTRPAPAPVPVPGPTPSPAPEPTPIPTTPTPTPTPAPEPKPAGQYQDGAYTGNVADAFFGPLQVQAIVTDGKITDVIFLKYPDDVPTSRAISAFAMPALKSQAIQKQNANVDIVSGATQTAEAFRVTLGVALAEAKN